MAGDADVQKAFEQFETVEWLYDGLGGKVISWTKEHGNENDDPSVLVFMTGVDGNVIATAPNVYQPSGFRKWLDEQAAAYAKTHPTTRVPFVRATVEIAGEGDDRVATCAELDDAREAGDPALVYVGRSATPDDDRREKAVVKASRKFEKGTLGSKSAAEAAEGVVLLRLDVADDVHALLARQLGAEKVPTLLLFAPGAEAPENLGDRISGRSLARKLESVTER